MLLASGGDGTMPATADDLVGTCIPFRVISRGTAKALGIPDTLLGSVSDDLMFLIIFIFKQMGQLILVTLANLCSMLKEK